jgi:DNA polymerase-1
MAKGKATDRESIYLIDAHSLIFQVFHAIPAMSSPSGFPTNAIFGFTRDVLFLRNEKKPDYLLCAFDVSERTFRSDLYAEYKAHRAPMPNDLSAQIPEIHRMLEALRVPVAGLAGYEADDVIATVSKAACERGLDVFICSSDKDCRQLINDCVQMYSLRKRHVFSAKELLDDWGITPEQVIDLQAMVGDSVDNVPGVPGVGVKTAAKLLQDYGTLDNVLANVDKIPGAKRQENLRAAAESVKLSRKLVTLATDVPIPLEWEKWRLQEPDVPAFVALCREWGFRSFAEQVQASARDRAALIDSEPPDDEPPQTGPGPSAPNTGGPPARAGKGWVQGDLFAPAGTTAVAEADEEPCEEPIVVESRPGMVLGRYHLVDTEQKFAAFDKGLKQQRRFAIDLETTHLEPRRAEIVGYAFAWQNGEAWYVPVRGPGGDATLGPDVTLKRLKPVLEDPQVAKVNQNIKYDTIALRQHGVTLAGVAGDSMVGDYLLHAGERSHSLEDLANRYLNHRVIPISDLIGKKAKNQLCMDQVPTSKVAEYAGEDADLAWRLCEIVEKGLEKTAGASGKTLKTLYDEVEIPLIEVLAELEYNGIRLDLPRLKRLSEEMTEQLGGIEREIYKLAGHEFNIASPKQLRHVLFHEMKLRAGRRTGVMGEASTDQDSLERLAQQGHALPLKIIEHRQIAKLKGTYVDALPDLVNPATGRIHASFNQTVAATGRLSSSDPNLQNIPVRSEQGKQIRQAFLPEEGWLLLTADYSQIELRLLAHFCGDENLRRAFAEDHDIHSTVASQIFGVAEKDVSAEMRRMAKTVNFGVIYGMSAVGLAARLAIPRPDAEKFIDAYFGRYAKVLEYQAKLLANCRKTGFTRTILGRRRAITGIRSHTHYSQRNQPEREAINMEIQGSAADLMKLAMLHIYRRLKREKCQARMLLTVHDELVFEVPPGELKEVAALVEHEMTHALPLEVPLKVDVAVGPNWLDVENV